MANNYTYSSINGVIIPDTGDIKETVQNEFLEAFQDLGTISLEDATPQGRLIDLETNARISALTLNAENANVLINIAMSAGPALDAWGSDFGVPRDSESNSRVPVLVGGVAGTVIPAGSQGLDVNGLIWSAESEIIIGNNGEGTGTFICSQVGAVSLGIGELNKIVASGGLGVDGWETLTNTANATLGAEEEADTPYKIRVLQSLFSGSALFGNYASALYKNVDGVRDVYVAENPNDYTLQLDNITLAKHSVFCCVDGGENSEVAYALYEVKSGGCGWNGNTTVVVTDKTYGTKNTVKYQIPASANFEIVVNAANLYNSSVDLSHEIKNVIVNYFSNNYLSLGYAKIGIRAVIEPFVIAALIQSQISGISVNSVTVGLKDETERATAEIIKGSITSGIEWATVTASTFGAEVNNINGKYVFVYDNNKWELDGSNVNLTDYGITVTGTPVDNDKISVLYATGEKSTSPIQIYANEKAVIAASDITVNING